MNGLRILFASTALLAGLALAPAAQAQLVIDIGGPPPNCAYGYYGYSPYACAPYGYYGPGYFYNGIFLGMGPWGGWGYSHGWGGHRFVARAAAAITAGPVAYPTTPAARGPAEVVQYRSATILRANPHLPVHRLRTRQHRAHQLRTQLPAAADRMAAVVAADRTVAAAITVNLQSSLNSARALFGHAPNLRLRPALGPCGEGRRPRTFSSPCSLIPGLCFLSPPIFLGNKVRGDGAIKP